MRYAENHKEETHAKIVERASQEFREHGFDGVAIAKLMSKLGLSHGGFYAHFEDKEDLKDQAMEFALDQSFQIASDALDRGGVLEYINHYTSDLHLNHPQFGCILATLSAEEGRRTQVSKEKFARKYHDIVMLLAEHIPGETSVDREGRAHFLISTLSGSVSLARGTGDPVLSASILGSAREQLTHYFRSL